MFLALCCVAAVSAVQLERKPFKRLIPADVLRGRFDQVSANVLGALLALVQLNCHDFVS